MPDPDAVIQNRDLTDKIITSRLLDTEIETRTFNATGRFSGGYETNAAGANTQRLQMDSGVMRQFSGDPDESSNGAIATIVSGSGDSRTLQMTIWGPSFIDDVGSLFLVVRSASFDDSTSPPGLVFGYTGNSTQTAEFTFQGVDLRVQGVGKATIEGELVIPAVTSDPSSPADGNMWLHTVDNALYIWEGGAKRTVASW